MKGQKAKTRDYRGQVVEVEILSEPDRLGMVKCKIPGKFGGVKISRHRTMLEFPTESTRA